jgi:alpha-glucosidase
LYDIANYWVDKGVGGFRMDAIPYIKKPADFFDGEPDALDSMVNIHTMTVNTPGILDFLHEFKQQVQDGTDIFTVGEANGIGPNDLPDWVGSNGVFDMIFSFVHLPDTSIRYLDNPRKLTDFKHALTSCQEITVQNGWYPIFFENHDMPRSINSYFPEDADPVLAGRAMGTVLLTLRGTPFIYEGEELGYENVAWPSIDDYEDLNAASQYRFALSEGYTEEEALSFVQKNSRDNARTPMQWTDEANAGFTTGTPWLPVHDNYAVENAEAEASDPASVLEWYHTLADFRQANGVLLDGDYREIDADSEQVYAFTRENGDDKLLIAVNFTGEEAAVDLTGSGAQSFADMEILLSSYDDTDKAGARPEALRPYEAIVARIGQAGQN